MAAYDPQGYRQYKQRRLQESQLRMQNDPGRIFLKAMAQAAPQATFNALGRMAVEATSYYGIGGKDKFEEQKRASRESEGIQKRRNELTQQTNELNTIKSLGPGATRRRLIKEYVNKYGQSPSALPAASAAPAQKKPAPVSDKNRAQKIINNLTATKQKYAIDSWIKASKIENESERKKARAKWFETFGETKTDLPKPVEPKPKQPVSEKDFYKNEALKNLGLQPGEQTLAAEPLQLAKTAGQLKKQGQEDRKNLMASFEKRIKDFKEASIQLGSVLRKARGKKKEAAIAAYNKQTEEFREAFLEEVAMLPKPEQKKALASVETVLKSGGIPDAARAAFDAKAVAMGMSVPQGYKGRTPRPGPSLGERNQILTAAKNAQKEADNARRQAQAARAAGNEEQAKQLETRASQLQATAVSQARASMLKDVVVDGRVVVGVDKPATEQGKKAVDIATEYYGAEGAVQNKSAALKKAAEEAGMNAQQISNMINTWNDLPGDSEKDAVFNELYNSLGEVLFSDLDSFAALPENTQAYISKKLGVYNPATAKKLYLMMDQSSTLENLTNDAVDSLINQSVNKLNQ
jgi:hypothetical protein